MTDTHLSSEGAARFRRLIVILEANQRYLGAANVEEDILMAYKELLHYLKSQSPEKAAEIIGLGHSKTLRQKAAPRFSDEQIRAMTKNEVKDIATNPAIPRRDLEQIASVRFGVTRGGLSNLRSRDALVQKLLTLIGNESAHESIARAVDASISAKENTTGE